MSIKNWPGGVISDVPPVPAGPYQDSAASGVWTLEQQAYWESQNLWPTAGSVNPDLFIENLFSTYLYTGTGATQTITNGIDLAGEGGLVWIKTRSNAYSNALFSTVNSQPYYALISNSTNAQNTAYTDSLTAFNSTGFTLGADSVTGGLVNGSAGETYASWAFRKQPKFFDIVTYTGTGGVRTVAHNLGSAPGCIILKTTAISDPWRVYHRSLGATQGILLNTTQAASTNSTFWNDTAPTSTEFTIGASCNQSGQPYVAYLWAHDAGGFGLSGNENVVSCGSWYNSGSAPVNVNLGYEPQWILIKKADGAQDWFLVDTMRGSSLTAQNLLRPNTSAAEEVNAGAPGYPAPTATGFTTYLGAEGTFIYIAIRRGPMAVPTDGTKVFSPNVATTQILTNTVLPSAGFPVDLMFFRKKDDAYSTYWNSRLLPDSNLQANDTAAEITGYPYGFDSMTSVKKITNNWYNGSAVPFAFWQFRRAPSFFDEVCYTGTGSTQTLSHNLAAVPELIIAKSRSSGTNYWSVQCPAVANAGKLNTDDSFGFSAHWSSITSTSITGDGDGNTNGSAKTYVAYLFATCPGVSKVTNFTGNGTSQTINCGFTSGARFVMIKATSTTGNWTVFDSARGISAGGDPALYLNSTAAEVTGVDAIDADSTGFIVNQEGTFNLNASGVQYLVLAIS